MSNQEDGNWPDFLWLNDLFIYPTICQKVKVFFFQIIIMIFQKHLIKISH